MSIVKGKTMAKQSGKVVDVRQACCYDTLTAPIKEAMLGMKLGETFEVIVSPGFRSEFNRFVEEEGHEILEEIKQEKEIQIE